MAARTVTVNAAGVGPAGGDALYPLVLERASDLITVTDLSGTITFASPSWRRLGHEPDEIVGRNVVDLVHPDDVEEAAATIALAASGAPVGGIRTRFARADGTYAAIETAGSPLSGADGRPIALLGISRDVSDSERLEGTLAELRAVNRLADAVSRAETVDELLLEAVDAIVEAVGATRASLLLCDEEHVMRFRAWRGLSSEYRARTEGHSPWPHDAVDPQPVLVADVETAGFEPELAETVRNEGIGALAFVPLVHRGRLLGKFMLYHDEPHEFAESEVRLCRTMASHIASSAQRFQAQAEAERRAHAAEALEFIDDAVLLVGEDGVVRLWNPAAETIVGIGSTDAVGRPLAEVLPGWEQLLERVPLLPQASGGSRARTLPVELHGRERWLSISGVRFPSGTVYAFRDVTEEQLVERMKAEFVSTVSHELRTPVAAVYGAAQTLRREDVRIEDRQRRGLLDVIASEGMRLARIVDDILLASRLDGGTMNLHIASQDPARIVEPVLEAARTYAPDEIRLSLELPADLPPIAVDADKLRQVLTNLVDNAIKYSPDGGRVAVRVARDGGRLRFSVADDGLGIPPSEQTRIWEKFYRLDPNLTRGVGGTGLGLYICNELVTRMRGRICVESDGRSGSTFHVDVPLA